MAKERETERERDDSTSSYYNNLFTSYYILFYNIILYVIYTLGEERKENLKKFLVESSRVESSVYLCIKTNV